MSTTEQASASSDNVFDEVSESVLRNLGPGWRPGRPVSINGTPPLTRLPPGVNLSNLPEGKYALSGISVRAFALGTSLGVSLTVTAVLVYLSIPLWRVPFFIAAISLFHFLEFYITALHNIRDATITAFLLSSNGWAYNAAHGSAIFECLVSNYFAPTGYTHWTSTFTNNKLFLVSGLILVIMGQTVRTLAMAQAGSNFNHTVQAHRREGHELVTGGIYRYIRHPSYFGFFWWGLGTQLVLQNTICFWIYAFVLSSFFANRIRREERFLIDFFGDEYVKYRARTIIGIPMLRIPGLAVH